MNVNIIYKLLEPDFVKELFNQEILTKYPNFKKIKKILITKIKNNVWHTTYHVVFKYETTFEDNEGKLTRMPIYCSAHSSEPRKNVYEVLDFLWKQDFGKGNLSIPHPLFYSKEFNATFYRGVKGETLYYFIKEKDFSEIEAILPKAAAWFAKLHRLSTENARNFNYENSRISTVFPGKENVLMGIVNTYPEYAEIYKQFYKIFISNEESFLNSTEKRWLVHGDAHPENIIKMSKRKLAVIDFTDLSLSDFARDLGTFLQQLEYMSNRKIEDLEYTEKLKKIFLENYFKLSKIKQDESLNKRIENYYNWTAVRTANYFLMKHDPQPERAKPLIKQVCKNLGLKVGDF
ncbi:MAG: hypothetical protein UT48_C0001G0055 [Parcubacteria group bacterium GW2011_GWE2_39_37]|uniref:Aminoglycoside phosphotransferase domain-containing protein n=1 Tax=Candidatus Falkowbacteria bacterium GW2011_GWF2_39_8 TaxID=1618642 RepID=A0A0G0Q0B6_9BACT|nr:MAG: hypothetical protein UT48_C0001G0055 [Parcubacteria group bacterium GW2011_GWE2_39_37]KKR33794.1 MAG: hypothetical protein UT64_C0003G0015 [Candidatus Falkowbacteria bacterium GW2011_GWF2_39_8]